MNRAERMTSILSQHLTPSHLELTDDSQKHHGHAGASPEGQTHYHLVIECAQFAGMNKIKRHQLIYGLLAEEFRQGLHALAIDAFAPGERK